MSVEIFSIGHSNSSYAAFRALLRRHAITAIADVRSAPYSKYCPAFTREPLAAALKADGIAYAWLGEALGGRPPSRRLPGQSTPDYEQTVRMAQFQQGLDRLISGAGKYRIALMCAEAHPLACHRCLLVGRALRERQVDVRHILSNGELISQSELEQRLLALDKQRGADMFDASPAERLARAYRRRGKKAAVPLP